EYLRVRGKNLSPDKLHLLLALVEATNNSIKSLASASPVVAAFQIIQLQQQLGFLEEWRQDPAWPDIARAIRSVYEFDHAVLALATAGQLRRHRNDVGLFRPDSSGRAGVRSADFWVAAPGQPRINVDTKAPRVLQRRTRVLERREAAAIVEKALH